MNLAIAIFVTITGLFGGYHAVRHALEYSRTSHSNRSALRLAFLGALVSWAGVCALHGLFWGAVTICCVFATYILACSPNLRREGYAILGLGLSWLLSIWAGLKPVALVVAVGALAACAPILPAKEAAAHKALDAAMAACHSGTVQTTVEAASTADRVNRFAMTCRTHGAQAQ